ncbi:RNA polymerase-associated protein LEO1-like [Helianthus annuus]|uniref:RNA polymerase-associated protein LEO1-like n=1 Tax=Helianthus annuus TaxID=4232 RepID=UPI001652C7C8|nr:RNA polymerase-associated protein LEO1-like [Helianthus annuus]
MQDFEPKRSKWFIKEEGKKKKGKKGTPKKAIPKKRDQRQLVDELSEDEAQNEQNVEMGEAGTSTAEIACEIEAQAFGVTENVGENVEGTAENVEGPESSSLSDILLTEIAPTTGDHLAKWRKKKDKATKKRKNSDEEDATYEPSGAESIAKAVKATTARVPETREPEIVEATTAEPFVVQAQAQPRSPIQQIAPIQTEAVQPTPPQQQSTPQQQGSTTKKASTPRMKVVEDKVEKLVKEKATSDKKVKSLEAENAVLHDKVKSLEAENVVLNDVVQGLISSNDQLVTANGMLLYENEQLKKIIVDHEADKKVVTKLKTKQMDMLFAVFESKIGVSVQEEFDQIEIQRAEARRIERERKATKEAAATTTTKDKGKRIVDYDDDEDAEDYDEEDDEFKDLDDPPNHPKDDNVDDDDQGGGNALQIVKYSGGNQLMDYKNNNQNEEREDDHSKGRVDQEVNMMKNLLESS